jgi:hypothetical protein
MAEEKTKAVQIPIEWHFPEDLKSQYATNMLVQHGENEFFISFFEVIPPVTLGPPEAQISQLEKIETVKAECIARIIVPAEKLPSIIQALNDNLKNYREKLTSIEE